MAAKPIAAMVLGVPTAPRGTHKLIGAITPPVCCATARRPDDGGSLTKHLQRPR